MIYVISSISLDSLNRAIRGGVAACDWKVRCRRQVALYGAGLNAVRSFRFGARPWGLVKLSGARKTP